MVGRRARKSMSGTADDSTTKFPISGKVPLDWLMHRLASPRPGYAQSVGVFVTPCRPTTRVFGLVDARSRWLCATCLDNVTPNTGSPCVATVQLGGVSRPSNVRASARSMSQWNHPSWMIQRTPNSCLYDVKFAGLLASRIFYRAWRLWCALAHCFLRSSIESFARVGCGPVGVDVATSTQ
ncbi:hypothetical protein V6N13_008234 [Hibiscus sabdariffa]